MKEPAYRVQCETYACKVRILVNDCPVIDTPGRRKAMPRATVNAWLQEGTNELVVHIEPPAHQEQLNKAEAELKGKIMVGDMTLSPETRPEVTILEFEFDPQDDTGDYPFTITEEFDVPTAFPVWTWSTAERLTVDNAFRREAVTITERLWKALDQHDIDTVIQMQGVKISEMAEAMFQRRDERIADVREMLPRLVDDPEATLRPLDPDRFAYPLFGNGRLTRVDDPNANPVIRYDWANTSAFGCIQVYLTRNKSGKVVWVR